jgi:fermentation-respiration switch protein FrsA (DUF1100 family)
MLKMSDTLMSLGRILLLLAGLYVVCAVGAHHLSLKMMFPRPPVTYAPGPDYLTLATPDGVSLKARYWPNPEARHTVLYLHGNYQELGSMSGEVIPAWLKAGYAVFAFDYRGYGWSGGTPTEQAFYADANLAYNYLRSQLGVPSERIVLFGYSLGGGPAIELARTQPVAGIVLQGAFVSAYRVMTRLPLFPADKFRNLDKVPQLKCPIMVIHGTADQTVPFWHGEKLYAAITARKAKLFVEGGGHGGLADLIGPRYWEEMRRFTDSL